jgi:hypothetical protein
MFRRRIAFASILLVVAVLLSAPPVAANEGNLKQAARGEMKPVVIHTASGDRELPFLSDGLVESASNALQGSGTGLAPTVAAQAAPPGLTSLGCGKRNPAGNVRVNQDCTFRRQAEEIIKVNPANPNNLIAGQNDSRIGWNHCGFDYSLDGGKTWGDGIPPFFQRLNDPPVGHTILGGAGTGHSYDAASDPALAFDSKGTAFFSCIIFDVNTDASAVVVTSSPAGYGGSFYNNVPPGGPAFIVAEDNDTRVSHDKQFVAADSFSNSPFRDSVYVTWTVFFFDQRCKSPGNPFGQCATPIYFSRSTNSALTWSTPKEISGKSPLCVGGNSLDPLRGFNDCDFNQGSDPIVLPDGTIVVPFNNGNTPGVDNQQLAVISTDGGDTWSAPVKIGDDIRTGQPRCSFGRRCIPGAFIRTNDFPRSAVNQGNGHLYVTWQDYRDGEFDIQLAGSTDGGRSWKMADGPVNPDSGDTDTGQDHYFPAIDVVSSGSGDHVAVSYYRTDRVPGENIPGRIFAPGQPGVQQKDTDYTLAGGQGLSTSFADVQLTGRYPPPLVNQAGFNGDYSGLVIVGDLAHPIWSDTRNQAPAGQVAGIPAPDEDIFTDAVVIP